MPGSVLPHWPGFFTPKTRKRGGDMPNEQNIIPHCFTSDQSREAAAKNGAVGGRASGVSRRRKRDLREAAELYLSLPVTDKRQLAKLSKAGVEADDADNQMAIVAGLALKAMRGDAKAAKLLFDLLPEQAGSIQAAAQEDDPITQALKEEATRGAL